MAKSKWTSEYQSHRRPSPNWSNKIVSIKMAKIVSHSPKSNGKHSMNDGGYYYRKGELNMDWGLQNAPMGPSD